MPRYFQFRLSALARWGAALVLLAGLLGVAPARPAVAASGDLDTTFDTDGQTTVDFATNRTDHATSLTYLQADGKLLVAGTSYSSTVGDFAVMRLNANGSVDTTFGASGYRRIDFFGDNDELAAMTVDGNGNIVLVGKAYNASPDYDAAIARLTSAGALDTSFDSDGLATVDTGGFLDETAAALLIQPDGKIVIVGTVGSGGINDFFIARLTTTGALDSSFGFLGFGFTAIDPSGLGSDDAALAVARQSSDGKLIVAGTVDPFGFGDFSVARLNTDGSLDTGFGDPDGGGGQLGYATFDFDGGADTLKALALQSDGKIVVAGQVIESINSSLDFGVARLTTAGALDSGFSGDGKLMVAFSGNDVFSTLALQTDSKILLGGTTDDLINPSDFAVARLTTAGALDTTFSSDGKATADLGFTDVLSNIALQSDGKIVAAGTVDDGFFPEFGLARFTSAGALDTTLGGGTGYALSTLNSISAVDMVALAILPDERMVVAGTSTTGSYNFALARFMGDTDFLSGLTVSSNSPTVLTNATAFTATLTTGTKETRAWNFGDGTAVVTTTTGVTTTSHTYATFGTYTVLVTATNSLNSVTGTTTVDVDSALTGLSAANSGPTALGSATAFTPTLGAGSRPTYVWNFGDGTATSALTNPSHTYGSVGVYTAIVTATNSVSTITATTTVTVDQAIGTLSAANSSPTVLGNQTFVSATISAGSNVSYQWNWGDGTALGSGANANHTYAAFGTYTVIVTATNSVSSKSANTTVNVDTVLSGLTPTNSSPTVLGGTTLFTATVSGSRPVFTWNFGDGQTGSGANANHTYAAFGTYTVIVTATNSVSVITQTTTVNVDVGVTGLAAQNSGPTVLGNATTLTATTSAGSRLTYTWNFGDGQVSAGNAITTHSYGGIGTYTVIVTATNSVSTQSANTTVNVDTTLNTLTAQNSGPTVQGNTTFFSATVSGSRPVFTWNFGNGQTGSGANANHTYSAIGTYTVIVTATNSVSVITQTTTVNVDTVLNTLAAQNSGPTVQGNTTFFSATVSGSRPVFTWNFGDGQTGSGANANHTYAAFGTYTVIVTATNSVGVITQTTTVNVDTTLNTLAAQNSGPTVQGNTTFFSATVSGSRPVFTWNFGDGQTGSGANANHTYSAFGTYTVIVTATNSVGVITQTTTVNVDTTLNTLAAQNSGPTVQGNTTFFTGTVSGSRPVFTWNFGDGQTGSGANANHTYAAFGTYTVIVTATNSVGVITQTTTVNVDVGVTGLAAQNSGPTVQGNTTFFTTTASTGSRLTYVWNFGDGTVSAGGATASHSYGTFGTYTVIVTATNSVSTQSANTSADVDQSITGLAAQNSGPTWLTYPSFLSATLGTGSRVTYAWNFGDGQTGSGANATHTYGALGTYTAIVTATNTVSVVTQTTSVTVTDIPISGLAASNNSPAPVFSATLFTASVVTGTNVVYAWNFGDGQTGSGATPSHVYTAIGSYTTVLTATNSAGAPVTTTTAVTITDIPVTGLAAQNSSPTALGNTTFFTSTIVTGTNVTYAWNFGDGQTGSGATLSHTYAVFGTYTAIVTATNGTSNPSVTTTVNVDVPASGLTAQNNSPTPSGSAVSLSATVSAGSRLTYAWDFGDGTTGAGANPTHAYGPIGVYTAIVTATNSVSSITATTFVTITEVPLSGISASNSGPTLIGQATTFTASVSVGSNPVYTWAFGDGQVGAGANPTHTYAALGVYTAVVTATNSVNFITTTVSVTIEPYRIFMPLITRVSAAPAPVEPTSALPLESRAVFVLARRR